MNISFVLVEPAVPENIGATARAIKTMGFSSLVMVNPCEWKEGKARWLAHGSGDILDKAIIVDSLQEALEGSDLIIATSAKKRSVKQDYVPVHGLRRFITDKSDSISSVSLVFGREESGLTNEEMKLCDITSTIEMNAEFPSLNLSHAVMIFAYELAALNRNINTKVSSAESSSFNKMKAKTRLVLEAIGISEDDNRYGRILERISFLGRDDVNLAHSICNLILGRKEDDGK
jgi:tRNA/rRNA methyltransferase